MMTYLFTYIISVIGDQMNIIMDKDRELFLYSIVPNCFCTDQLWIEIVLSWKSNWEELQICG